MINSYLILQNGEETGPYTLYEVMDKGVSVHTMILSPLADGWQEACDLPEFQKYFEEAGLYFPTLTNMAGFWWRLLAYIIDYILRMLLFAGFGGVLGLLLPVLGGFLHFDNEIVSEIIIDLVTIFFGLFYHAVCEASTLRGSIGKVVLKISVVDADGRRISFGKAIARNIGKLASGIAIGLGYLSIFGDEHKQGWHDHWAKTYVIRRN